PITYTYFVADSLIPPNVKFWSIKPAASGGCTQQWIDMSSTGWKVHNIKVVAGTCMPDKASSITVNNTGAGYYFFEDAVGVIHPAFKGSSDTEFTRIIDTKKLWSGSSIYIQTKPVQNSLGNRCPRLLIQESANRWEFLAPIEGTNSSGPAAAYYRSIVDSYGPTKGAGVNCDVGDINAGKSNSELALSNIVGGTTSYWGEKNGFNFTSFKAIKGSVEILGNAVGTVTAAELRLGTQPSGSMLPSQNTTDLKTEPNSKDTTTCAIDGIGWIICPVMNFMAKVVDGAYTVVGGLLKTPAINTNASDPANGTYQAWAIMRTIANVAFVIAFLLIIFSQLTSVGITNYGVKKMLPRIVIAAILVNLSYFICAIAVDLSNILGSSMVQIFDNIKAQITTPDFKNVWKTGTTGTGGLGWEGLAGALLAGVLVTTVGLYAGLSVLLPALIAALVAIVTVFLVLTLRQALIIILIVISPLAFVAFLLPNTESLFNKWRSLLTTLLLMFPIIALIFGGSALASKVVMASSDKFEVQVMGALVAIIPLFITPIVMKTAGGLLNRFGGFVNNPNKGPFDRMRKGAEGYRNNRQEYRKLKSLNGYKSLPVAGGFVRRKARREAVLNNRKTELNRANASYVGAESATDEDFRKQLARGSGEGALDRAKAASLNVKLKLERDEIEQAIELMVEKTDPTKVGEMAEKAFITATKSGETTKARAAQKILATQLGAPGIKVLHESIKKIETDGDGNVGTMSELKRDINNMGLKGKDNAVATWGYTPNTNIKALEDDASTYNGLNPVELAGQNAASLAKAERSTDKDGKPAISAAQARFTLDSSGATALLSSAKVEILTRIANGEAPPLPSPTPPTPPPATP
ncbi:hypothetical protein H7X69_00760, partial [Candidatus Saccharibacteria bacterium]|nr:hypothetical protein [Candidatus Saccharibacteria bacterium]